ncbi:M14 family metallopeptidase [Mailhella massiliensis]|uniref:M14 family metallopeptidase n=1 Tax=Mailhella massiliensis TaxID=1903261 RepID=A0A921DS72_9BACT|nr:M14 family metallopeptidase [Mailhella massiliensis]HJD98239.1 M14 family metallopeptidase [Mailhella massiliensis]
MKRERLFVMSSPFRDEFRIHGFRFGSGRKSMAIVGAMRGDELQQQFVCSRLVHTLQDLEERGELMPGHEILIIPSANPFAMNIGKRFWAMDNTDINRMFPGYPLGETTQRIAAALFEHIQGYQFGVQLASYYLPGDFIPHVRMMHTGYEDVELAQGFGLPYTLVRNPLPIDTTTLNYNWQIWETQAFSVYAGHTGIIDASTADDSLSAILRFMALHGLIRHRPHPGYYSQVVQEDELINVKACRAGIMYCMCKTDDLVRRHQRLAHILDPYDGSVRWEVRAPEDGTVFFMQTCPLVLENSVLFKLIPN